MEEEDDEEEEEEQDEDERDAELHMIQLDNIRELVRRGNAVDIRTLLHTVRSRDEHDTILWALFELATLEIVQAVVLRDGVWAKADMCPGLVMSAMVNNDPAVLVFLLGYGGYRISTSDRQFGIYEAVRAEKPGVVQQLLGDPRFDPVSDDNAALRLAYDLAHALYEPEERLRPRKTSYDLLLHDHRVLDSLAPSLSEFARLHHRISLFAEIEEALAERRLRRMAVPTVTRGLPQVSRGMTAYTVQNIMEFAGITAASVGECKCKNCNGDKLP